MLKSELYRALRTELHRHDFCTFVEEPPCIAAQGGNGVVVTGCPTCRKKFGTMPQFLDHLTCCLRCWTGCLPNLIPFPR